MDKRNSKNSKKKGSRNKLEAMHLLPEIDVKSVKNYVHELLRRYHIKLSELTSECLICTSSLFKNWQDTKQHLKNPSHINNITRDNKQFTAICILCNYILIADDADYIFEHFILHKAAKGQIGKEVLHEPFENDPNSSSSSISSSTLIYKDNVNIHTNSSNQKYTFQKEKECLDDVEDTFRSNEGIAEERHESSLKKINMNPDVKHFESSSAMKKNLEVNTDNDHGISRTPKLGVNCIKTSNDTESVTTSQKCIYSSSTGVSPFQKDIDNHVSDKVISSHNFVSESSNEFFYPKLAFFSNKTLQLISPGVSEEEFTFSQEMNAVNIRQYCVKMYYSEYYALRKIYFSCLECNVLRLRENYFFKHLTRIKHSHNLGDGYDICFIKICDICQVLLLGHMDRIKEHFQCHAHKQSVKCKLGLIKQQYAVISGKQKLGFSGMLTDRCTHFFSSKEALNSSVESSLKEAREVASLANQLSRILERDIKNTLKEKYSDFHVEVVGSRLYELANHQSDVDIHLNIGDVSVGDLQEYFHRAVNLFEVQRTILDAKVPIIRLKHLQSSLICDINTTNPTGFYCSDIIKLYISLDERIRWLAMAIIEWSAENDIRGTRKFKSYTLMCLVLFFLMSPKIRLIPSVHTLKSLYEGTKVFIKGWDYSFCRDIEKIKKVHNPLLCNLNKYELLAEFFKYYSRLETKGSVLFPHNGEVIPKRQFSNPSVQIPGFTCIAPFYMGGRLILIDFFNLRENVCISVDENLLDHFQSICHKTLLCGWQN